MFFRNSPPPLLKKGGLQRSFVCKTVVPVFPEDQVIQNGHIEHHPGIPYLVGDLLICFTGLDIS